MVTKQDLGEHIGRRPFRAFRVLLNGGEVIEVVRPNQAVAMDARLVVATPEDRLRWVKLEQIQRVEEAAGAGPA
jgi:hypothetical protein